MKLFGAVVLFICLVQMCAGANEESKDSEENYKLAAALKAFYHPNRGPETPDIDKIRNYLNGSAAVKDISPQFVDNVNIVLEKYQDNFIVMKQLKGILGLLAETLHGKNATINVDAVKELRRRNHLENGDQMDQAHLLKAQLSKQLPPVHVNGIINVILMVRRNATDDEIENALGYVYGTVAQPMTIDNVEPLSPMNCMMESYAGTNAITLSWDLSSFLEYFKNNTKINPKIKEDIATIAQKIPCSIYIFRQLKWVMNYLVKFDKADLTETGFCSVKDNSLKSLVLDDQSIAINLIADEILFSTQFPDKDLSDFLNLLRFLLTNKTTGAENEKAFAYVYGFEVYESMGVHPNC